MLSDYVSALAQFLKDDEGRKSSMRVAAILSTATVMAVWTYVSLIEVPGLAGMPATVFYLLTTLWTAKQVQTYIEKSSRHKNQAQGPGT